jgi:hypothetical protein
MKPILAIVAGTGFEGRAAVIRAHCANNAPVYLAREPDNKFDPNAIAVYLATSSLFGLIKGRRQIGYIKAARSATLAPKIDSGELKIKNAFVTSFYAPEGIEYPRVSITIVPEDV